MGPARRKLVGNVGHPGIGYVRGVDREPAMRIRLLFNEDKGNLDLVRRSFPLDGAVICARFERKRPFTAQRSIRGFGKIDIERPVARQIIVDASGPFARNRQRRFFLVRRCFRIALLLAAEYGAVLSVSTGGGKGDRGADEAEGDSNQGDNSWNFHHLVHPDVKKLHIVSALTMARVISSSSNEPKCKRTRAGLSDW